MTEGNGVNVVLLNYEISQRIGHPQLPLLFYGNTNR
jgi:hypothetical protein